MLERPRVTSMAMIAPANPILRSSFSFKRTNHIVLYVYRYQYGTQHNWPHRSFGWGLLRTEVS